MQILNLKKCYIYSKEAKKVIIQITVISQVVTAVNFPTTVSLKKLSFLCLSILYAGVEKRLWEKFLHPTALSCMKKFLVQRNIYLNVLQIRLQNIFITKIGS